MSRRESTDERIQKSPKGRFLLVIGIVFFLIYFVLGLAIIFWKGLPIVMEQKWRVAFGILFCGSANGVTITANKHQHVRAGLSWENDVARLIRRHNNANVICIPARFVALSLAEDMIALFIDTAFEGGRHQERVNKISCS